MVLRHLALIPTLGLLTLAAQAPDTDAFLERLTRLHARLYPDGPLLAAPGSPEDVADWRRLMAEVARLASAPGQQELTEVLKRLQAGSEELIGQRQRAWEAVQRLPQAGPPAPGEPQPDLPEAVRVDLALRDRAESVDRAYGWAKGLLQGPMGADPRTREALLVLRRLGYLLRATLARLDLELQERIPGPGR